MNPIKTYAPWLGGPASTLAVYGIYAVSGVTWDAQFMPEPWIISKYPLELAALILLGLTFVVILGHALMQRDRLAVLLTVGVGLLLLREWHFDHTPLKRPSELGIYTGLPVVMTLGWMWRKKITASEVWPRVRPWLVAAIITYAWSVIVSRRVFRFFPYERAMHISFEETAETVGHLLMVGLAITVWVVRCRRKAL